MTTRPASEVVHSRLRELHAELADVDPEVRADTAEAVHRMRVAVRRMRSVLSSFRPFLDPRVSEPLRGELSWLSDLLAGPRDAEVMRDRLSALADTLPDDLMLGPVRQRFDDDRGNAYRDAHVRLVREMESERYNALLDALERFVANPQWSPAAADTTGEELLSRVRREWKRLRRRVRTAETSDSERRGELFHEVRKAAKRARYAAEVVQPVYGTDADRFIEATKRVQTTLGELQDSLVARDLLRRLAIRAHLAGENGFTYGFLHALESDRGAQAEARFAEAWRKASRRKVSRWLRMEGGAGVGCQSGT